MAVCKPMLLRIVLTSIQLNSYFCRRNIEVQNVIFNVFLSFGGKGSDLQKIIPKVFFFGCHIFSQLLCVGYEIFVVFIHFTNKNFRNVRVAYSSVRCDDLRSIVTFGERPCHLPLLREGLVMPFLYFEKMELSEQIIY